ncbi:MAG: glutamate-5-semialdehyde dehydrogenase [Candidatus Omnitrophica bacterium]|nr:glutamate-5-semialdehyde dehydrogenase [Candidatus Omnitrophota bacterium]
MVKLKNDLVQLAKTAQEAFRSSLTLSSDIKNAALRDMSAALIRAKAGIIKANKKDVAAARVKGIHKAFIDRLVLDDKRIKAMADSLTDISALPDPVDEVISSLRRPNGLWIHKVRAPIGVIAIIYESRPNVTSDCIGLCFKSGNSVILRGGSEALNSNLCIYNTLREVLKKYGIHQGMISMVMTQDRKAVAELLQLNDYIDLVMPRGGESLIESVVKCSKIPVIKHYKGICHVYVDEWADLNMAQKICFNAKVQRPGVCNAMESMLVHHDVAARFLPGMIRQFKQSKVEIRGCPLTVRIGKSAVKKAKDSDYRTEFSDLILAVKVVSSLQEAVEHINIYGSHHSDSIVTDNYQHSLEFMRKVDSACVYTNASTRFTDGGQFGMGAEIGISTDKLHARGPMALQELTTYKYMVFGNGQVRL